MNDTLIAKQESIERCVRRARSAWEKPSDLPFEDDYDKQDIIILNLQRACEQALDMASHTIREKKLGWFKESAESFRIIREAGIIDADLEDKLIKMVGFRNVVAHQYQDVDLELVKEVVQTHADDLIKFAAILVAAAEDETEG